MQRLRKLLAVGIGMLVAAVPSAAFAAEEARSLDRSDDWMPVMLLTFAALAGVMLLATVGYLYRARRNIVWGFQQPEPSHDEHH